MPIDLPYSKVTDPMEIPPNRFTYRVAYYNLEEFCWRGNCIQFLRDTDMTPVTALQELFYIYEVHKNR